MSNDNSIKAFTVSFTDDTGVSTTVCILARSYIEVDRYVRDSRDGDVDITAASYKYPIDLTNEEDTPMKNEQYIVTFWNGYQHVRVMSAKQFWMTRKFSKAEADAFVGMYSDQVESMRVLRYRSK